MKIKRHYPVGAECLGKGVHFRIWAPDHKKATLVLEEGKLQSFPMKKEKEGYFSCYVEEAKEGSLYRFRLGNSQKLLSDPASRYQPKGVFGPSMVVNPKNYPWKDSAWQGIKMQGQVLYEMHFGTFTKEGTYKAAKKQLEELKELGITTIELMPLNDFYGHFGWGYDGVNLFAPTHLYGTPDELKDFINKAHDLSLGVILDVVYNHLGPEGNQLFDFAKEYIHKGEKTDWGEPIYFDSPHVREYFLTNARYWIEEFHFDGLRFDVSNNLFSTTPVHILADFSKVVREAGGRRKTITIAENEPQNTNLLKPYKEGGYNFDALWNDDFHHTAYVRITGKQEAYYTDYLGTPQEFITSFKYGFLYQGQYYKWQKKKRGTANLKVPPESLVIFLENHDQIANSGLGLRLYQLSDKGNYRALTALFLLSPNTPMLFQGQEFGSQSPFFYFADHSENLSELVRDGRRDNLSQFPRLADKEIAENLPNPEDPRTFIQCKLDFDDRKRNASIYQLHKDLLHLRKNDPVFKNMQNSKIDGAVLGENSFLIRYFGEKKGDRLLLINFGTDQYFSPAPEPLLVAGTNLEWEILWSSESVKYGGGGTPPVEKPHWNILGHSAMVLKTVPKTS